MQLAVFRGRLQIESAGEFMVDRKIAHVNGGVDHWSIERSGSLQSKVGASFCRQRIQMNLANSRKIEILSLQIEPEASCRRRISRAAGNVASSWVR